MTAFLKIGLHLSAPCCAVCEQLPYIQSMPFSSTRRMSDCVSSSHVSLNASDGLCPFARSVSNCASITPASAPIRMPRSPTRSLVTSFLNVVGKR